MEEPTEKHCLYCVGPSERKNANKIQNPKRGKPRSHPVKKDKRQDKLRQRHNDQDTTEERQH